MKNEINRQNLEIWLQQAKNGAPDPELTQAVADQILAKQTDIEALLMDLHTDIEDEVNRLWEATLNDEIPEVDRFPSFNTSFLSPTPEKYDWPTVAIQEALIAGVKYISDQVGDTLALVGQALRGTPTLGLATKSSGVRSEGTGTQLLQYDLGEAEGFEWDMEVIVFAEDEETCKVEISIFHPESNAEGIQLTLYDGETEMSQITNAGGVTVFEKVPRKNLEQLVIRRENHN